MQMPLEERQNLRELVKFLTLKDNFDSPLYKHKLMELPRTNLVIQDGPYCPNNCEHCYGDFGKTPEKASLELYQAIMDQIDKTSIDHLIITDGEPFHDFQRLNTIMDTLKALPVEIVTSGTFATSDEKTREGLTALREGGFTSQFKESRSSTEKKLDTLGISVNKYLPKGSLKRAIRVLKMFQEVFPDAQDAKEVILEGIDHHRVTYNIGLMYTHKNDLVVKANELMLQYVIANKFDAKKLELMGRRLVLKKKFIVSISGSTLSYNGRAKNILSGKKVPISPDELGFNPLSNNVAYIKSDGNVYLAGSYYCTKEGRNVGNIFHEDLGDILAKEKKKGLFLMEKVLGVRGIYEYFQTALGDDFEMINGWAKDGHCDVCRNIFSDKSFVDKANIALMPVVQEYMKKKPYPEKI